MSFGWFRLHQESGERRAHPLLAAPYLLVLASVFGAMPAKGETLQCPTITGTVGVKYSSAVGHASGTAPFTFSIAIGRLPPGLALALGTGAITGTPISEGFFPFAPHLIDSSGGTGGAICSITIAPAPLPCDFTLMGPGDVPGLSEYIYQINLPPGKAAIGTSWKSDKSTASVRLLAPSQEQAVVTFQNTKADWITLKANFTLDGNSACAVKQVALVKVDVGPPKFTTPGKSSGSSDAFAIFLDNPPANGAKASWVTTYSPGSNWQAFQYNGTVEDPEDGLEISSAVDLADPAIEVITTVFLTSPTEKPDALHSIQFGFIQNGSDLGAAAAVYEGKLLRKRIEPTSKTVDWITLPAGPKPGEVWPWYGSNGLGHTTGGIGGMVHGDNSWIGGIEMEDSPTQIFPAKYNPNDAHDPNKDKLLIAARALDFFFIRVGARTLDAELGADEHYFDEANFGWAAYFVYPPSPGVSSVILPAKRDWTTPSAPSEIEVNVVPAVIEVNAPYRQWEISGRSPK